MLYHTIIVIIFRQRWQVLDNLLFQGLHECLRTQFWRFDHGWLDKDRILIWYAGQRLQELIHHCLSLFDREFRSLLRGTTQLENLLMFFVQIAMRDWVGLIEMDKGMLCPSQFSLADEAVLQVIDQYPSGIGIIVTDYYILTDIIDQSDIPVLQFIEADALCRRNLKVHQKRNYRLHHSED